VLRTAGIQNTTTKLNITLGITCSSFAIALMGAACVDRLCRRPLLLFTKFGCASVWIGITAATGSFAANGGSNDDSIPSPATAKPSGTAALAMIYIFGFVYSFGFTPLQALYPVEVLSFEMRAKGKHFPTSPSALVSILLLYHMLCANVPLAGLINQFAWPVSLQMITWKTYITFVVWDFFQTAIIYFFIPETKNRTVSSLFLSSTNNCLLTQSLNSSSWTRSSQPRTPESTRPRREGWQWIGNTMSLASKT
jgi:hypothetical protein